jgi:hypothetical protein
VSTILPEIISCCCRKWSLSNLFRLMYPRSRRPPNGSSTDGCRDWRFRLLGQPYGRSTEGRLPICKGCPILLVLYQVPAFAAGRKKPLLSLDGIENATQPHDSHEASDHWARERDVEGPDFASFRFGMRRIRDVKSICSILACLRASGRLPESSRNQWNSRRMGLSSARSWPTQGGSSLRPSAVFRRFSEFQSTAVTGFLSGQRARRLARMIIDRPEAAHAAIRNVGTDRHHDRT